MLQQGIIKIDRKNSSYKIYSTQDKVTLSKVAESLTLRELYKENQQSAILDGFS